MAQLGRAGGTWCCLTPTSLSLSLSLLLSKTVPPPPTRGRGRETGQKQNKYLLRSTECGGKRLQTIRSLVLSHFLSLSFSHTEYSFHSSLHLSLSSPLPVGPPSSLPQCRANVLRWPVENSLQHCASFSTNTSWKHTRLQSYALKIWNTVNHPNTPDLRFKLLSQSDHLYTGCVKVLVHGLIFDWSCKLNKWVSFALQKPGYSRMIVFVLNVHHPWVRLTVRIL